jgi:ABC-2 type transport system permease protein
VADLLAYRHLIRAQIRAQAQYRASFVVDVIGSALITFADLSIVLVLFRVTNSLGGFDFRQTFLLAALAALAFQLSDLVVGNVERVRLYVRTGLFDAILVRPRAVLPQLLVTNFTTRRVGSAVQSAVVLSVAVTLAPVHWTVPRVALFILTPIVGSVFFMGLFVSGATVAFYWIESGEFANAFTYGGREFTTYPMSVYGGAFRRIFGYGLGFAFVSYYPGLVILGRPDPLGAPAWLGWCTPLVSAASVGIAALLWRTGIRHYRSTGS